MVPGSAGKPLSVAIQAFKHRPSAGTQGRSRRAPELPIPFCWKAGLPPVPAWEWVGVPGQRKEDLAKVPEGAVLVSPTLPPAFAAIIQRLRAVVADLGSRASHFAMVAREYGLPVLVGTPRRPGC